MRRKIGIWVLAFLAVVGVPLVLIAQDVIEWPGKTLFFRGHNPSIKFDGTLDFLPKTTGQTAYVAIAPGGSGTCQISPPSAIGANGGYGTAACSTNADITATTRAVATLVAVGTGVPTTYGTGPMGAGLVIEGVNTAAGQLSIFFKCLSLSVCPTNPAMKTFGWFAFR